MSKSAAGQCLKLIIVVWPVNDVIDIQWSLAPLDSEGDVLMSQPGGRKYRSGPCGDSLA